MLRSKIANPVNSFRNLRRLIGILGMALPLVCFVGGLAFGQLPLQPSVSAYYYTNVRDVFVGLMVAVALFLITYRGYEIIDDLISTVTGIAGLGVALFPCLTPTETRVGFFQLSVNLSDGLHSLCAGLFFLLLAVNSFFIFTITGDRTKMTRRKRQRNLVYRACGLIILAALLALALVNILGLVPKVGNGVTVFLLEIIMLEAFGISWLVKGEVILTDRTKIL